MTRSSLPARRAAISAVILRTFTSSLLKGGHAQVLTSPMKRDIGWEAVEKHPRTGKPIVCVPSWIQVNKSVKARAVWLSRSSTKDGTQGPPYTADALQAGAQAPTRGNEQGESQAPVIVTIAVNLFHLLSLRGPESCVYDIDPAFCPSQESHGKIMIHMSTGVCGTGNQRIKLGGVFGKFSKYNHGLSECCQFYHQNARSAIHALSPAPGAHALSESSVLALVNYRPSLPTFLLQFVALSAIFTPFRVIYSRHKIDWENALINVISDGFLVPSGRALTLQASP